MRSALLLVSALLAASSLRAADSQDSFVGVMTDTKSCSGGKASTLPLPDPAAPAASLSYLSERIDEQFGENCKLVGVVLKGYIGGAAFSQMGLALQLFEARRLESTVAGNTLWLDSQGGLISEAMKIGDLIAIKGMSAIVMYKGRCFSSCVLIYAAAKTRSGIGDVGIHRPFMTELSAESLSYAEYLANYEVLSPVLKQFFAKYGVSPAIVDAMNVVPSDEMRVLDYDELVSYGLGYENVAAREHEKARTIQICGADFHELSLQFFASIEACRVAKRLDVGDDAVCWDAAREAFPRFHDEFQQCQALKERHDQSAVAR